MELRDYFRIARKSWLVIVIATLLGVGASAAWIFTRTPIYESSSIVFVSTQSGSSIGELQQGSNFTQARVQTYAQLVTTPSVVDPVIEALGLDQSASDLSAQVTASNSLNTTLITITASDPDPQAAADLANALATSLAETVESIEAPRGSDISPVRLTRVKDATPAARPTSPNVSLGLLLGGVAGLVLGIVVAASREALDTKVRSRRDVTEIIDSPIIGAIPYDPRAKDRPLIVHADPQSPRAESFRTLRTNLQFIDLGERASFVITSSIASEGKSTTAINLSIALADAGKRVALIDTDLRKPKVAEYLGVEGGAGLTDVLIGKVDITDVMLPWGQRETLFVLPAGKVPPNPSELLGSRQMSELLSLVEREFDIVICDGPPLLPVTDAAVLAKQTSGAIIVAAVGKTSKHQLAGSVDALATVGAHVAGVVMSMTPTKGPDAYHSYSYAYGYGSADI